MMIITVFYHYKLKLYHTSFIIISLNYITLVLSLYTYDDKNSTLAYTVRHTKKLAGQTMY